MIRPRVIALLTIIAGAGCTGGQAAFDPAGAQASRISSLWWLFCWTCLVVYVITIAVILVGVLIHRRRGHEGAPDAPQPPVIHPDPLRERRVGIIVASALGVTIIILFVFMFSDYFTGRALASLSGDTSALTIRITGRQWVVGGALRRLDHLEHFHHRQRNPHPRRAHDPISTRIRRCHSQLLGAASAR